VIVALAALLASCSGGDVEVPEPASTSTADAPATVQSRPEGPRVPAATTERVAASHVLVAYVGAVNAVPNITRSRDEARARAEDVRRRLIAGEDFASVALTFSDDGTAARGGRLGGFGRGVMVQAFDDAVRALEVGAISAVVETPFGFHVIRRDPLLEVRAAHLVVSFKGADRAPAGVGRSRDEARARAEDAAARLAAGEPWEAVVRTYTDGPGKEDGGDLGWFARGQLAEPLDAATFALDPGATTSVIETPRGFHILRRVE
jgi:parvulin-like peptidyl-prolyl isomerase